MCDRASKHGKPKGPVCGRASEKNPGVEAGRIKQTIVRMKWLAPTQVFAAARAARAKIRFAGLRLWQMGSGMVLHPLLAVGWCSLFQGVRAISLFLEPSKVDRFPWNTSQLIDLGDPGRPCRSSCDLYSLGKDRPF